MIINGEKLKTLSVFPSMMTVPDCIVTGSNKLGHGHGEAKFYISSKDEMRAFYGGEKFNARCFMLKADLLAYMQAIKNEYHKPSQNYARKEKFPTLWAERIKMINKLDDVIFFNIADQYQIAGPHQFYRRWVSSYKKNCAAVSKLHLRGKSRQRKRPSFLLETIC